MFTCITLSSKEMQRNTPSDVVYYNHVREFSDTASLHSERLNAITKVQTPYFFFCDYDDPIPEILIKPNKGILYGDNYLKQNNVEKVYKSSCWQNDKHLSNPYLIHKAICNTELSKKIAMILPKGEHWTEVLLYYSLALIGGYEYIPEFKIIWNKKNTGFHTSIAKNVANSVTWLLNNQRMIQRLAYI
jgi:hypothetical protein